MKNRSPGRLGRLFLNAVALECRSPGSVVASHAVTLECRSPGSVFHKIRNTTDPGLKPSGMTLCDERRGGFTLIELLVVVLIIGILAAVALPQYEKAVNRARYTQAQTMLNSLYRAEKVYYMANGSYTTHFSDLDIDVPKKHKIQEHDDGDTYEDSWGGCKLHDTGYGQCHIKIGNGVVWYMRRWGPGETPISCWVFPRDNQKGRDFCRTVTGGSAETSEPSSNMYTIYYF